MLPKKGQHSPRHRLAVFNDCHDSGGSNKRPPCARDHRRSKVRERWQDGGSSFGLVRAWFFSLFSLQPTGEQR